MRAVVIGFALGWALVVTAILATWAYHEVRFRYAFRSLLHEANRAEASN